MKIYIPSHLKEFTIIDQLEKLILGYSEYYQPNQSSFDDYEYSLANDPVKYFINLCLTDVELSEDQQLVEVVNYISKLFYSVKGTNKVLDYVQKYLSLEILSIDYTTDRIIITLNKVITTDEGLFMESFREFLDALLYVREYSINSGSININIENNVSNWLGLTLVNYIEIEAE